jgi:FMN phosphatase YigB (HAD superfamily)
MRLLSDFDGVWTDQTEEARVVREAFVAAVARAQGQDLDQTQREYESFLGEILAQPHHNGWAPHGRLTAFVDEDPLLQTSSVGAWLDRMSEPSESVALWREAARSLGHTTVSELANEIFGSATREYLAQGNHSLVPEAREVMDQLLQRGVEVVVVSNSDTSKLAKLFENIGLRPDVDLRLRGGAGKYVLGDTPSSLSLGGRQVFVDRPRYAALLLEENPDLVIGDVTSLDLALPYSLRASGQLKPSLQLILRQHPHTPDWVLPKGQKGASDRVLHDHALDGLRGLLAHLE